VNVPAIVADSGAAVAPWLRSPYTRLDFYLPDLIESATLSLVTHQSGGRQRNTAVPELKRRSSRLRNTPGSFLLQACPETSTSFETVTTSHYGPA
jgi:hypothetical protein